MPLAFMAAVKVWNSHHKMVNTKHVWAVPRKGTTEHAEVKRIMSGEEVHKVVATKTEPKRIESVVEKEKEKPEMGKGKTPAEIYQKVSEAIFAKPPTLVRASVSAMPKTEMLNDPEGVKVPDPTAAGDSEDLELTHFKGVEIMVGTRTGNIYIQHDGADVFVGNAGKGRFKSVKPIEKEEAPMGDYSNSAGAKAAWKQQLMADKEGTEVKDDDEDLESFEFKGADLFQGVVSGNIYIVHEGEDVFIGNAEKGRFKDVKRLTPVEIVHNIMPVLHRASISAIPRIHYGSGLPMWSGKPAEPYYPDYMEAMHRNYD